MKALQIRNINPDVYSSLKLLAHNSGERGVEPYVRAILQKHVQKADFLADMDANEALFQEHYGGALNTNCVDMIREDRDA